MIRDEREFSTIVAGACFAMLLLVVYGAAVYAMGNKLGTVQGETRPTISTGQPPVGVPVLVFWTRDDGTVYAESAIKTDYAGVLPFSVSNKAVPYDQLEGFEYWSELDGTFAGVRP